jgi:cold shock protein
MRFEMSNTTERLTGFLKHYVRHKGYGFIRPQDGSPDVWVHATAFCPPIPKGDDLPHHQHVSFVDGKNERTGAPCAINVELIEH